MQLFSCYYVFGATDTSLDKVNIIHANTNTGYNDSITNTPLNFEAYQIAAIYSAFAPVDFSLSGIRLTADTCSLMHDVEFSASILQINETEVLDNLMINVTGGCYAYRLLPHGVHFSQPARIELAYEPLALPRGFQPDDIYTYYYNEELHQWQRMERVMVDTIHHVIVSLSTHFTDFINAVIRTPEMPEMNASLSTQMLESELPHPFEHLVLVEEPEVNTYGSAQISYPITIPAGRNGLQPDISLSYNSSNGNGLLGLGWAIPQSAITIDTRWGVPRYDTGYETEIYTLNGMQCVLKDGNPDLKLPYQSNVRINRQSGEVNFIVRDTKNCDRIIRHGNSPKNYWWEVIDRRGTISYYGKYANDNGVNSNCVLVDANGNIGYWALSEVVDLSGNYIKYEYAVDTDSEIYPKFIYYTGHRSANGDIDIKPTYRIYFHYDTRADVLQNGRLGFIRQTDSILCYIDITYFGGDEYHSESYPLNRRFLFHYNDTSTVSLLSKIQDCTNYSDGRLPINGNCDLPNGGYSISCRGTTCFDYHIAPLDSMFSKKDVVLSLPDVAYQSLNASDSRSWNVGGTATVGFGAGVWNTNLSVGGNYNYSASNGKTEQMLLDMNGDGLTDWVYIKGDKIYFCPQQCINNVVSFGSEINTGISAKGLSRETSKTNTWGLQAGVEAGVYANVSGGKSYTDTYTSSYFSDINNDGLPDYIDNGKVYFNSLNTNTNFIEFAGDPQIVIDSSQCNSNFYYDGEVELLPDCIVEDTIVSQYTFNEPDCSLEYCGTDPDTLENLVNDTMLCEACDEAIREYINSGLCPIELHSAFMNTYGLRSSASPDTASATLPDVDQRTLEEIVQGCLQFCDAELPCPECVDLYNIPELKEQYDECKRIHHCRTLCGECVHYLFNEDEYEYLQCADRYCLNGTLYSVSTPCTDCEDICVDDIKHCRECITGNPRCMVCQECYQECSNTPEECAQCKIDNNCLGAISEPCLGDCMTPDGDMLECGICILSNGLYCEECRDTCEQYPHLCRTCVNRHCHYDETDAFTNECWNNALSDYESWVNTVKKKYSNVKIVKEGNIYYAHQIDTICPENTDPEIEAVRVWIAPETGTVTLRSTIQLIQDTSTNRAQARRVDGVRCLIQHNKNVVAKTDKRVLHSGTTNIIDVYDIAKDDYLQQIHTYSDISVNEGDVFFFHLRSCRTHSFDNVDWEQIFTYDDGSNYSSTDDFICYSDNVFRWENDGVITLNMDIVCQSNTTGLLKILVDNEAVDSIFIDSTISEYRKELSYSGGENVSIELSSLDNSNLGKIEVKPHIVFTTTSDTNVLTLTQWLAPRAVFPREVVLDSTYYQLFGPLYRGWGQFGYNNISAEDVIPIHSLSNSAIVYSQTASSDSATFCQSITFSENDTLAIMQDGGLENEFTSRNLYNPLDNAWIQMTPDISQYRWEAYGVVARNGRTLLSNTRDKKNMVSILGAGNTIDEYNVEDIDYDSDVPVLPKGQRVTTIRKTSKTTQWNVNAGFGALVLGLGKTYSESHYDVVADFMDMNGDGYPDIVRDSKIQYSQPWGGLGNIKEVGAKSYSNYSVSNGSSVCGNYAYAKKLSGSNIRDGKFVTNATGNLSASGIDTKSNATIAYLDINGDGLSDKIVKSNNKIYFYPNIGYGFASGILLSSLETIDRNISHSSSGSIGGGAMWEGIAQGIQDKLGAKYPKFTSRYQMSLALGLDMNYSTNTLVNRLIDMNGDGILDVVKQTNRGLNVSVMSPQRTVRQTEINNHTLQSSSSFNWGVNAGITAGLTVWFVKLCFGVNGSPIGQSTTQTTHDLIDMNGDGLPDLIWVDGENIHIRYNQTGKNHLLKQITNSTGQILQIDYELSEPTREQRGRQWLMSSVSNIDPYAHPVLGCDTMIKTFTYANPHYDYAERQFLGYGTAITHDIQTDTIPHLSYRKIVRHYNNQDFMEHGKMVYEGLLDAEDNLYREYEINTWYVDSAFNQTDDLCDDASIRVGTEVHYTRYYEGEDRIVTAKKYDYDRYHNVKEYINLGDSVLPKDNLRATIEYDSTDIDAYNLVSLPSKVIIYNAEVACRELQAEYQRGLITEVRKIDLQGSHKDTTNYHYDTYGLLDSIIFPSNSKGERAFVVFAYDTFSYTLPAVMTDHWGRETQRTYDKLLQVPRTHIDPSGNTWKYTYDHFGRTTNIIAPMDATKSENTITYEYILSDTNYSYTRFKYSDFEKYTYYDSRGNILYQKKIGVSHIRNTTTEGSEAWFYSDINSVDCFGRTINSYRNYIDRNFSDNNMLTIDSLYLLNTSTWDILDRPVRIAWSNNLQKTYDYSIGEDAAGVRRLKQIYTDEQGHSTLQFSAPQGWVTTSVLPTGNTTQFEYDAFGQLLTSIDPEGLSTIYQYDGLGRKISRFHPDAGVTQWSYDHAGNIITSATQKQLNNGNYTTYEYDYDRLKKIHYPRYSQMDVTYEYDSIGRISKRTDITGYESFKYDIWGNVSESDRLIVLPSEDNAYRFKTQFQYDVLGRIQHIIYPDGDSICYNYRFDKLLDICSYNEHIEPSLTPIQQLYFDAYGKPIFQKYGNGYRTEYTYDPMRLWLTKQKIYSADHLLQDQQYSYDAIGNITHIEQIADSVGWLGGKYILDYQYDSLYRLIRADMSSHYFGDYSNYQLTYSPSGLVGEKRCDSSGWDYQYGYKYNSSGHLLNHQLQSVYDNSTSMKTILQWDADGQLLNILRPSTGDIRHHWWNESGLLAAFVDNEHCGFYGYDGNGERVYKLTGQSLLDQYNAGEQNFQMYFRDAVLYVNPYMVVTPRGYTKHYYNGSQRIAARIGRLDDLTDDIVVSPDTAALERINNVREYMTALLNIVELQDIDTTGIIADIEGNRIGSERYDYSPTFGTNVYYDSNILYPILTKNPIELDIVDGVYFCHPDHLGSATWITDSAGAPIEYIHYMPYGELWTDQQASAYVERYRFTGKERDSESGYDYFGARHYSSTFPMWLTVDPLSDSYPDISPYAYCGWNPVNKIDPNGMWIESAWDITNIVMDAASLRNNIRNGNVGGAVVDGVGLVLDAAAAILPFVPAGAGAAIKAYRTADKVANAGKVTSKFRQSVARGIQTEQRVLKHMGLTKNTKKIASKTKIGESINVIPDAIQDGIMYEIKDTKVLNNTKQIQGELNAAKDAGYEFKIVTGENTHVSSKIPSDVEIIRRPDINP